MRNLPECNGKVALLGYCLGALMVFMTAARCDGIDAAVWYHGDDTEKYLGEVASTLEPDRRRRNLLTGYASWLLFNTSLATTDVRPVKPLMCSVPGTPK